MSNYLDIPVALDASTGPAFVSGVAEALFAAHERSWGLSEGKVYHNLPVHSDLEAAHAKGCEFACAKMVEEADQALEMKKSDPNP